MLRPLRVVFASAGDHPFGRRGEPLFVAIQLVQPLLQRVPTAAAEMDVGRLPAHQAAAEPAPARAACRARSRAFRFSRCPARAGGSATGHAPGSAGREHGSRAEAVSPSAKACRPAPPTNTGRRARAPWPRVRRARRSSASPRR